MDDLVRKFFVKEGGESIVNKSLDLDSLGDDMARARFLVAVIRHWHTDRRGLFCEDIDSRHIDEGRFSGRVYMSEDEWEFRYKTPSDCPACVGGQEILDKIFGHRSNFNILPFVKFEGDRKYSFRFELLKLFAKYGREHVEMHLQHTGADKDFGTALKPELVERRKQELAEILAGGQEISPELMNQLLRYDLNYSLVIANPQVAALSQTRCKTESGETALWCQVIVLRGSQNRLQEWQWIPDDPSTFIHDIGEIRVVEENGTVVEVELCTKGGNRSATFRF